MLKNYFKIAFRNLWKSKGYASINILGLAMGVTTCLLILQFVGDELSFDQHHVDSENIYRVDTEFLIENQRRKSGSTPSPLAAAIKKDFPEVLESTRIYRAPGVDKFLLKFENQSFFEKQGIFADSNFFEVLTYEFVEGNKTTALDQPFSIVLSDEISKKLFGENNPIGKTIQVNSSWGENDYQVTGVFDKEKYQSHLEGDFYISGTSGNIGRRFHNLQEWGGNNLFYTYVKLQKGTNPETLTSKLPTWLDGYAGNRLKELGMSKAQYLTAVGDIYLRSEGGNWAGGRGDITFIYILIIVAVFILLIACINFMNLATAKATIRAKEVGVRKVMGATRTVLTKQFMTEAFVYVSIAVVIAYIVSLIAMPAFNQLTGKELSLTFFNDFKILFWLVGFILITTFVAGSYPALYLSSFNPVKIFRKDFGKKVSSKQIRQGLVVFQFCISVALILGILVIHQQMEFIKNKNLGFSPEAKLVVPLNTSEAYNNYVPMRNVLLKNNQIHEIGAASSYPGETNLETYFYFKDGQTAKEGFHAFNNVVTPEFMEMMNFELVAGRQFDPSRFADTLNSAVISETAMRGIGFNLDNVLGQNIHSEWQGEKVSLNVIGVIKDYHASSLHNKIQGQVFEWRPQSQTNYMVASVATTDLPKLLTEIKNTWSQFNLSDPFEFQFMEDRLQQNYVANQRMSQLILWGTLLAIFISCLGLIGLSTFAAERRKKEIGVRKVLGASILNIVGLLSRDFLKLVLIALVVALPLSWYGLNQWLNSFAYRIEIGWAVILLASLSAIGIVFITVGVQSAKAALNNPVESLKNE